jgi:hypothetical protein
MKSVSAFGTNTDPGPGADRMLILNRNRVNNLRSVRYVFAMLQKMLYHGQAITGAAFGLTQVLFKLRCSLNVLIVLCYELFFTMKSFNLSWKFFFFSLQSVELQCTVVLGSYPPPSK